MKTNNEGFIEAAQAFVEAWPIEEVEQIEGGFVETLKALLRSRKVLLAAFGVVTTIVAHYGNVPPEVWASIDALIVTVIAAIAYEDAAEKRAS